MHMYIRDVCHAMTYIHVFWMAEKNRDRDRFSEAGVCGEEAGAFEVYMVVYGIKGEPMEKSS